MLLLWLLLLRRRRQHKNLTTPWEGNLSIGDSKPHRRSKWMWINLLLLKITLRLCHLYQDKNRSLDWRQKVRPFEHYFHMFMTCRQKIHSPDSKISTTILTSFSWSLGYASFSELYCRILYSQPWSGEYQRKTRFTRDGDKGTSVPLVEKCWEQLSP